MHLTGLRAVPCFTADVARVRARLVCHPEAMAGRCMCAEAEMRGEKVAARSCVCPETDEGAQGKRWKEMQKGGWVNR